MRIITNSRENTIAEGRKFAGQLSSGAVVVLEGDLGGGKTTFIKGVLTGLGYRGRVLSPTFTLIREYKLKKIMVYHIDLYRLNPVKDFDSLGLEDILYREDSLTFIEWGEKIEKQLPRFIKVEFKHLGEDRRQIVIEKKL
jgi:tRNA threonylcarbamoyladenosine biosynthesis protein TsaE